MKTELTHWIIIFVDANSDVALIKEYDFEEVEARVWNLRKNSKFIKVLEAKEIFENGKRVEVEIKEEEV